MARKATSGSTTTDTRITERRRGNAGARDASLRARGDASLTPGEAVAAYVRVSSASQTHDMQRTAIERAASARGHEVGEWFADVMTGGTMKREAFQRLRAAAREGRIRVLYVYRLDRLTRTGIRDTLDLIEELRGWGVRLQTVADGFDVEGPAAEVVLAVLAWAAKIERLAIGERIASARQRAAESGAAWGRPRRMSAEQVDKARKLAQGGQTVRQIAVRMRVPRATIARALNGGARQ